ncbi:pantoate kinase [Halobaculum magnesiiphilum]|uniref:Pantoate kinase n=1 Tax=Halobaculum magnesiiphilum TaxID=1017351 RepID=A0A8T8WAH5_9EURY|nr:sugar kinase [Halobaculum magnesiiphilum]QZP36837.1 sugar kinase [Halobaculum magnesiiphilum]
MDEATAFAPGHVTAFFAPYPDRDPVRAGSRGAGLALSDGVEVTVRPADGTGEGSDPAGDAGLASLELDGVPAGMEPVERVLAELNVAAEVEVFSDVPVGAGFGVSGAAALATALAANAAFELDRSENDLVRVAHAAEAAAGTGLGDVVGQFRGGLPVRLEPGAPGYGRMDGVPARPRVEYVSFGELSTERVLGGDLDPVREAGEAALTRLMRAPDEAELLAAGREFAVEAGLQVPEVAEAVEAVEAEGGLASMAMLGRTVYALGTGLSDAGYDPAACSIHPTGATLRPEE